MNEQKKDIQPLAIELIKKIETGSLSFFSWKKWKKNFIIIIIIIIIIGFWSTENEMRVKRKIFRFRSHFYIFHWFYLIFGWSLLKCAYLSISHRLHHHHQHHNYANYYQKTDKKNDQNLCVIWNLNFFLIFMLFLFWKTHHTLMNTRAK